MTDSHSTFLSVDTPLSRAGSLPQRLHLSLCSIKWRKAAGVEPARERMPSPTGFEARPRHRARLPSLNSVFCLLGQCIVEPDVAPVAKASGQDRKSTRLTSSH